MGIRMDQVFGLNEWAEKFVKGKRVFAYTERVIRTFPDGKGEVVYPDRQVYKSSVKKEKSGEHFSGMFDEKYSLHKYTFPDGKVYFEKVQAEPWSSGPCFFLALVDEKGEWVPESLWPDAVIENA